MNSTYHNIQCKGRLIVKKIAKKTNKKGKYQAIIKYCGNKYFKAITKKVKITIK